MIKNFFSFDPDIYIKKEALALEINDFSITLLSLFKKNGSFFYETFGSFCLPPGLIEKGKIRNYNTLILVLQNLLKKTQGKAPLNRPVIMSIPEEIFFSRVSHISENVDNTNDPQKLIEQEIQNHFPLYPSEVYYDYNFLNDQLKTHKDVFITASPKKIIDEYINMLKELSLEPFIIEGESLAISRAILEYGKYNIQRPTLIIDINDFKTIFIIYFGQAPRFCTNLAVTFTNQNSLLKNKKTILDSESEESLLNEIEKYLSFYEAHPLHEHLQNRAVTKIILSGVKNDDLIKYISSFLAQKLKIPVEISAVNNILHLSGIPRISTAAVGLAFRILKQ